MNLEQVLDRPASVPPSSLAARILLSILRRAEHGRLKLIVPNHRELISGSQPGPEASMIVRRPWALLFRLLRRGAIGFFEAYRAQDWSTADLTSLLHWSLANRDRLAAGVPQLPGSRGLQRLRHILRPNSPRGSRRNIAFHYDLGNDFYRLWLDQTMSYSSAVFEFPGQSLADAQRRKYRRLLEQTGAQPGDHVLEIGCGWGGFCEEAARQGIRVTGITLSREQLAFARQRMERAGLSHLVELRLQDYRDVQERFDHVVSIEMFEAVGETYWPTYFSALKRCLKPGGRAALQLITIDQTAFEEYRRRADFIQLFIFPGGMLPSVPAFRQQAEDAGFRMQEPAFFGRDYAETLRRWHRAFVAQKDVVRSIGFDDDFYRTWRYYLSYCETGFDSGRTDLMHVVLEH